MLHGAWVLPTFTSKTKIKNLDPYQECWSRQESWSKLDRNLITVKKTWSLSRNLTRPSFLDKKLDQNLITIKKLDHYQETWRDQLFLIKNTWSKLGRHQDSWLTNFSWFVNLIKSWSSSRILTNQLFLTLSKSWLLSRILTTKNFWLSDSEELNLVKNLD